jgi:hypothetical protein
MPSFGALPELPLLEEDVLLDEDALEAAEVLEVDVPEVEPPPPAEVLEAVPLPLEDELPVLPDELPAGPPPPELDPVVLPELQALGDAMARSSRERRRERVRSIDVLL